MRSNHPLSLSIRIAALAAIAPTLALAGNSTNSSGSASRNDGNGKNPAVTVSYSGQVALKPFSNGPAFTFLTPGTSITLYNGPNHSPVVYTANTAGATRVQLASPNFSLADTGTDYSSGVPNIQNHSALRIEWHEQGSAEGLIDVINDQVGYVGGTPLSNANSRGPSTANPTWVNTNQFTGANTLNGLTLAGGNFGNTYDATVYNRATGQNLQGGQDRVQFSQGEYKTESFARAGAASPFRSTIDAGYGQGNPALRSGATLNGLGVGGGRQSFRSSDVVNPSTDKVDPQSATGAHYTAGPWNTAGANNIDSRQFAVTAVAFTANPGTGLSRINEGDAQWLQAQGRLSNGAEFNTVSRSADTGQRIVAALNTGLDPSWAVGENDDGNTSGSAAAAAQRAVGPNIRFSGKTSGSEARNAIAQSRLGFGALSLAETRGAASTAPIRALDVAFNNQIDPTIGGAIDGSKFVHLNFDSLVDFKYEAVLISHYNTIKQPRPDLLAAYQAAHPAATADDIQTWWNDLSSDETAGGTGIKGDTYGGARAVINNVSASIGTAASGLTPASVSNAADGLFINGLLIPQLLNYKRTLDGGALTPNPLDAAQVALQQNVKSFYGDKFTPDGSSGSIDQTVGGSGTATYGALGTSETVLGAVPITAKNADGSSAGNGVAAPKGNYLFGNFNQDGKRDFASVKQSVNAALSLRATERAANVANADSSLYRGVTNNTTIASASGAPGWASTANTKGDLIVLGDFNTDGAFDGKDVYLLARGASLSDGAATDQLTTASGPSFGDQLRNSNAKLNKNAALDFAQAATANGTDLDQSFLRKTARATLRGAAVPAGATLVSNDSDGNVTYTFDAAGANAFNKLDINRDGRVTRDDAAIVDSFVGKDYRSFTDQVGAVVRTDLNPGGAAFANNGVPLDPTAAANAAIPRRQISLVDVELTDNGVITATLAAGTSDFKIIRDGLASLLLAGDTNFDGAVDFQDLVRLAQNYNTDVDRWSAADFNLSGHVDFQDLVPLAQNYNSGTVSADGSSFAADWALAQSLVPEPTSLGILAAAGAMLAARRRPS
jgi:hypothetical protein